MLTWSECWKKLKKSNPTTLQQSWPKQWAAHSQKLLTWVFKIIKGSGKRMQDDQLGQGSSKKARTYVKRQKRRCKKKHVWNVYIDLFLSQEVVTKKISLLPRLMWEWSGIRGSRWWCCQPTWSGSSRQKLRGTSLWK